jgi:D-glycero-D-manno-heptose 1,7-bisphosphate phosphatase
MSIFSPENKQKACFLDRDGVVNVEVSYLHEPEKTVLENGIVEALKAIHQHGFLAVVVTNQAGVARGKYPEEDIFKVHSKLQELLAEHGEKIDAFYYCPHHPEHSGECACRKPNPGMLLQAAKDLNIDVPESLMIGDRMSDVNAGRNAGCKASYLVRTGYGLETLAKESAPGCPVADNAYTAFMDFIAGEK